MAQTTSFGPYPWFDIHWRPRRDLAASVLRKIQDRWLLSDDGFPTESTVAVILHIFAGMPNAAHNHVAARTVDEWFSVVSDPITECARLLPKLKLGEHRQTVGSLCALLADTVGAWVDAPHSPSCERVVMQCLQFLASQRYIVLHR